MDATKILEEMDQFKELWNQVAITCGLHSNEFFYTGIKWKQKIMMPAKSQVRVKVTTTATKKQQNETDQSNLEVKTCQWC